MTYSAVVESVADRRLRISQSAATGRHHTLPFRGSTIDLDVKRIPASVLVYRMANMRTMVMQQVEIRSLGLDESYFSSGEENQEAQGVQHRILVEMAKDPTADIHSHLSETKEQRDPLLVTVTGVVVNGNRRLAAMRDLFAADPIAYSNFSHIEVAVLPDDASEDDLSEIETRLQIAPDLRSEYGWVEEALGLRDQITRRGWPLDRAASVWGEPRATLNDRLQQLVFAENYLDHIGRPHEYALVKDSQQAITTFLKSQKSRGNVDPSELDAERLVMFAVLSSGDIQYRKYDYARDIQVVARQVVKQVDANPGAVSSTHDPNDPLAGLSPTSGAVPAPILDALRDPQMVEEVAELAEAALADHKSRSAATRRGRQLQDGVSGALQKISGLQLTNSESDTYPAVINLLVSTNAEATRLMSLLLTEDPSLVSTIDVNARNGLIDAFRSLAELLES
jgi:hypothetical protein